MKGVFISSVVLVAAASLAGSAVAGAGKNHHGSFETLSPGTGIGLDVDGVAKIRRTSQRTSVQAHVRGLKPGATYAAHLHNAPCAAANPGGGHYKHDPTGPGQPPNELWLSSEHGDAFAGITANSGGVAHGRGSADWVARPEASSIVLHAIPSGGTTAGGPKIACADLE